MTEFRPRALILSCTCIMANVKSSYCTHLSSLPAIFFLKTVEVTKWCVQSLSARPYYCLEYGTGHRIEAKPVEPKEQCFSSR